MADHIKIGDVAPRIQYMGDGAQTVFTYPFPVFKPSDMEVYLDDAPQTTGYAVNGAGESTGGDVTFSAAPASGTLVTLRRRIAIQRTSDFQESGEFRSKVINDELDYLTAALQQVSDDGQRTLRLGPTDSTTFLTLPDKAQRTGMFLAFDDDGDPIASDASGPPGPTGPAGNMNGSNNLSEIADAVAARANLGLGQAAVESVAAGGSGGLLRADGDGSALTGIVVSDDAARANIVLNAFRIAVQGGLSVQNMADGVVDEFEDQTGVDDTASTGETYDATNDFYTNLTAEVDTLSVTAASNVAFGGGASGNYIYCGFKFTSAVGGTVVNAKFDISTQPIAMTCRGEIYTDNSGSPGTLVGGVSATIGATSGAGVATFTWNSNPPTLTLGQTYWFVIHDTGGGGSLTLTRTASDGAIAWGEHSTVTSITDGSGNCTQDGRFAVNVKSDMTLYSEASTASAQPDEAFIVVWQQDVDAVTPNTDIKAYVSRDGGTTWTQITLSEESLLSTGRVLAGSADISGQPAGTSMKWKLETLNAREMKIHGVGLEWS